MEVRRRITTMFRKRNLPYNVGLLCEESSRCIMPLYRQDNRAIKFAMWISSNDKNIHDRLLKFSRVHCIYIYIFPWYQSSSKSSTTVKEEERRKKKKRKKEEYSTKVFLLYLQERGRRQSCCSFDEIVSVVLVSSRCLKDRKSVSGTIGDIPELIW